MPELRDLSRRSVLAAGAAGVGSLALVACGSSGGGDNPTVAAGGDTSGGAGSAIAKLSDIKVGETISAQSPDGKPLIVARPTETTAAAFSAICTHNGCTVKPAGGHIQCPCHGSTFNNLTGANTGGPAPRPLAAFPVQVQGDEILPA